MGEQDKSVKVEKEPKRRLSFANRLRLYGSLAGTLGLIAFVAAGCGGKGSSGDKDGAPKGSGNTHGLPQSTDTGDSAPTYSSGSGDAETEDSDLPGDTMVDVELYSADGSGETYIKRMSFVEMQGLCESEIERYAQQAQDMGLGEPVASVVALPYNVVGGDPSQQLEYTCEY